MRKMLLIPCAVVLAMSMNAEEKNPIDRKLSACIDKDPSTGGMVECIETAYAAWDKELNAAYQALSKKVTPEQKDALKVAQRQWLAWRDAEFAMLDQIYGGLEGTMYVPMAADNRMGIVKARAVELRSYEELIRTDE